MNRTTTMEIRAHQGTANYSCGKDMQDEHPFCCPFEANAERQQAVEEDKTTTKILTMRGRES